LGKGDCIRDARFQTGYLLRRAAVVRVSGNNEDVGDIALEKPADRTARKSTGSCHRCGEQEQAGVLCHDADKMVNKKRSALRIGGPALLRMIREIFWRKEGRQSILIETTGSLSILCSCDRDAYNPALPRSVASGNIV
jgi:hypothetical protein